MKHYRLVKAIGAACVIFIALPHLVVAGDAGYSLKDYVFIEPGPTQLSTLYVDGSVIEVQTETRTRPMCSSDISNITPEEFKRMMLEGRQAFENDPNKIVVGGNSRGRGPNIIFNVSNPPPGAEAAFDSVSAYLGRTLGDPITVTITVLFAPMGPGIIGGTSCYYTTTGYTNARDGLINGMDSDDTIQVWLPSGTIPVRYNGSSGTVTDENQVYFTKANYKAAVGTVAGTDAFMQFNTDFSFDWDPSNGISGGTICFQSVAIHETGHALGFTSRAESWYEPNSDIDALDIYRFQNSDGAGDYNPDTYAEFTTTARLVDYNNPNNDHNSDIISAEYLMCDGTPYQASHFSTSIAAIMDPNFGYGETFYPNFLRTPDTDMFDAIGWDYPAGTQYTLTINLDGDGTVDKDPDLPSYPLDTPVQLTANPDPGWDFDYWSGGLTGSDNPDTIIMDENKTVTAHFYDLYVEEENNANTPIPFLEISPNPAHDRVAITYGLGQGMKSIDLKIYSVTGQLVKDFSNLTPYAQGPTHLVWDGKDYSGREVASGVYLLKFIIHPVESADEYTEIRKVLLLQ